MSVKSKRFGVSFYLCTRFLIHLSNDDGTDYDKISMTNQLSNLKIKNIKLRGVCEIKAEEEINIYILS